jgi:hypothetical protein
MICMKLYVLCYVLFTDIDSYKKNKSGFVVVVTGRCCRKEKSVLMVGQ